MNTIPNNCPTVNGAAESVEPVTVLLIEDDLVDEMAIKRAIATDNLSYDLTVAHSITEARQILTTRRFDIVLSDYKLSDGTLFDLQDILDKQSVIIITGSGDEGIAAQALHMGMRDYLIKDMQGNYLKLLPHRVDAVLQNVRTAQKMHEQERQLCELFDNTSDLIQFVEMNGKIAFVNRAWREALGYSEEEISTLNIFDVLHQNCHEHCMTLLQRLVAGENVGLVEISFCTKDRQRIIDAEGVVAVTYENGVAVATRSIFRDITERRANEKKIHALNTHLEQLVAARTAALTESEERFRALFDQTAVGVAQIDTVSNQFIRVNQKFADILGYTPDEILAVGTDYFTHPLDRKNGQPPMGHVQSGKSAISGFEIEQRYIRKDGVVIWVRQTISPMWSINMAHNYHIVMLQDITSLIQAQERINYIAYYDALTSLPNRNLLLDRLDNCIANAQINNHHVALLIINIDRFKIIDTTFGHTAGNALLKMVARRIESTVREDDTVARLNGDEFAIILANVDNRENAINKAQNILNEMSKHFILDGKELFITASIGISLSSENSTNSTMLLNCAREAMYHAKASGKNQYQLYSEDNATEKLERFNLETSLRRALERNEFFLDYQPQVDSNTMQISGLEALLRWRHPDGHIVPPLEFIPLLEETGMIVEIGDWVLQTACTEAVALLRSGLPSLKIAVNISLYQFRGTNFVQRVLEILQQTGLKPESLELEITEGVLVDDVKGTTQILEELHTAGVRLSIDDFGTGYSSIHYLQRLPFDTIKIDKSFIQRLPDNKDDAAIVEAIVAMAHSLELEVITEGVETHGQLKFINELNCHAIQGYYFSPPISIDKCMQLVKQKNILTPDSNHQAKSSSSD